MISEFKYDMRLLTEIKTAKIETNVNKNTIMKKYSVVKKLKIYNENIGLSCIINKCRGTDRWQCAPARPL